MIKFTVLASSSAANCYKICDGETPLLIECGLSIREIRKRLNFTLGDIHGCLTSHEHQDHARAAKDLIKFGTPVYMSRGTAGALGIPVLYALEGGITTRIGSWNVYPFDVTHDAAEPLGFLLTSRIDRERLLFITDAATLPDPPSSVTILAIEANYCPEILRSKGKMAHDDRVRFSHLSINDVVEFVGKMDKANLREVYLLHLSNDNSDANEFRRRVMAAAGVPVYIAEA